MATIHLNANGSNGKGSPPGGTVEAGNEIKGTLAKIRYAQDGFCIAVLDCVAGGSTVIKGSMLKPNLGLEYTLRGKWIDDPKWGRQFAFDEYKIDLPKSALAVRAYLAEHCEFVGPVISQRLLDAFGEGTLEICKTDPHRVAETVKGLSLERAQQIAAHLRDIENDEALDLSLKELLAGTKITRRSVNEIKKKWRHEAPEVIKTNPYSLIEHIEGVGFAIADEIAKRIGFAHDSPFRLQAGILYTLEDAARGAGHVCLPRDKLLLMACDGKVLGVARNLVNDQVEPLTLEGKLVLSEDMVYLAQLYRDERYVAHKLRSLLACEGRKHPHPSLEGLGEDQVAAVTQACEHSVFALTGAPGTGKTTAIKQIINSFPGARVELAAPTGKAARRMTQQTGREAKTIHRLLGPTKDHSGRYSFSCNERNPIAADLVILDEVSMLDTWLAARALEAVAPGTRLVLVGDSNQLPSVGPGNILRSILESGIVPAAELTQIKRQDPGLIVRSCHRIKDGLDIQADNSSKDLFILEREEPEQIRDTIVDLLARRLAPSYKVDPLRDIQVITALREKTILSCKSLNEVLQQQLNQQPALAWTRFKVGDKVIQLKNEVVVDAESHAETSIANGDIGYVCEADQEAKKLLVEFESPRRMVKIPARDNSLDLAYAVTVHKFQGSECPIIVIPIHKTFGPFILQRPWVYTAISRAKTVCILVGQREEIGKTISRNKPEVRHTRLLDFLREGQPDAGDDDEEGQSMT